MPILDNHSLEFFSHSPQQTQRVGIRLGALLQPGDLICLQGELGAGKTTFVQGVAQGWGSLDAVSSPTFILVNQYRRADGGLLCHLDAYRLESTPEAAELDLDQLLAESSLLVEWPERIQALLPAERLWITLEDVAEEQRRLWFLAVGKRYDTLLARLRHSLFGGT
jgi:tRNA threonylcarbamoyladenosine biosynthesis protein TsaE